MHPYVRLILLFLIYSYVKSHLDNDSCLPIYKTITAIYYAILRIKPVRTEFHFSALRHGDYVLWAADLWFAM